MSVIIDDRFKPTSRWLVASKAAGDYRVDAGSLSKVQVAARGASIGAAAGSVVPGIGNTVGTAIGGAAGLVGGLFGLGSSREKVWRVGRSIFAEALSSALPGAVEKTASGDDGHFLLRGEYDPGVIEDFISQVTNRARRSLATASSDTRGDLNRWLSSLRILEQDGIPRGDVDIVLKWRVKPETPIFSTPSKRSDASEDPSTTAGEARAPVAGVPTAGLVGLAALALLAFK